MAQNLSAGIIRRCKRALKGWAEANGRPVPKFFNWRLTAIGEWTRDTIRAYQADKNLAVTGLFDEPTRVSLVPPPVLSVGEKAADRMEAWAKQGWSESPPGSNKVPELAAIAKAEGLSDWYQKMTWPWCMFAAFLALKMSGSRWAAAGFSGKWNVLWTVGLYNAAIDRSNPLAHVIDKLRWTRGTVLLFDFPGGDIVDHVGILLSRLPFGFGRVLVPETLLVTAEGNTSGEGKTGSQSDGGQMAVRWRRLSQVKVGIEVL